MVTHIKFSAEIVDVKTTFFNGGLEEEIYMECLQGMSDVSKDDCFILNKYIYGFVQASRQHDKKGFDTLKIPEVVGGYVNSCLYGKKR